MTEPTSTYVYPQDKVRIAASYRAGSVGAHVPAGQPETIEITLNDESVPADSAERIAFLAALIDALFRTPPDRNYQIGIHNSGIDPDRLTELAQQGAVERGRR